MGETDQRSGPRLLSARAWLLLGAALGAILSPLAYVGRSASDASEPVTIGAHLAGVFVLVGLAGLARAGPSRALGVVAAIVAAARSASMLAAEVLGPSLASGLERDPYGYAYGYGYEPEVSPWREHLLLALDATTILAAALTFAAVAAARPRSLPVTIALGALGGALAWIARLDLVPGDLGSIQLARQVHVSASGFLRGAVVAVPYAVLVGLVRSSVAPDRSPGDDLPPPLRETGGALRAFVFWARARALTVVVSMVVFLAAVLAEGTRSARPGWPLLFVLVVSGVGVLRALLRMRRGAAPGSSMRTPATAAIVLAVLHAIADLPWLAFFFFTGFDDTLSAGDLEPLPMLVTATMLTAWPLDAAVGVVAGRFAAAVSRPVFTARIEALFAAAYLVATCLSGAVVAGIGGSPGRDDAATVLGLGLVLVAIAIRAVALRETWRATADP